METVAGRDRRCIFISNWLLRPLRDLAPFEFFGSPFSAAVSTSGLLHPEKFDAVVGFAFFLFDALLAPCAVQVLLARRLSHRAR